MIEGDELPTIEADRVRLRWLESRDVSALYAIFSSAEVTRYWSWPAYSQRSQAAELLETIHRLFLEGSLYQWGLERVDVPGIIGTCTLSRLDRGNRRAEIGFALGRAHWGQGYMTEALRSLLGFAFDVLGLHRIEADVDPRNEPSLRILERLGFRREGVLRERWLVSGEACDSVMLGLLAREWTPPSGSSE